MEISGGSAQLGFGQLNMDGETYSTSSKVTGNFAMTLRNSSRYLLTWRFNKSQICTVAVNASMSLIPALLMCDSSFHAIGSDERYYADNSQISGTVSSGVLRLDLVYAKALFQEYPLFMDVFDNAAGRIVSNVVNITVQNCTNESEGLVGTTVSESCEFNCTAMAVCDSGFVDELIEVTCLSNAKWDQTGNCSLVTSTKTPTTSNTSASTTTQMTSASTTPQMTSAFTTTQMNVVGCVGCTVGNSSNGDYKVTCVDQRYNKKSSPAAMDSDGIFIVEISLYCIGYTAGYIAGIVISVIGGLEIVANFVIVAVARNTVSADGKNTKLLALGIISTVVWAVSIGLLFGLEKGDYDMNKGQIAGCVIGSIASVGVIVSCAWSGMVMKQSKKNTRGRG